MVLQGCESAYETDLLRPVAAAVTSAVPGATDRDIRIVTDHVRASTFILSEGVAPSNEGRGYIPRRLLRKAIATATQAGAADLDLRDVADAVITRMRDHLPPAGADPRPHPGPAGPRAARLRPRGAPRPGPARRAGHRSRLRDHRRGRVHPVHHPRHAGRPDPGLRRGPWRHRGRAAVRRAVRRASRALPRPHCRYQPLRQFHTWPGPHRVDQRHADSLPGSPRADLDRSGRGPGRGAGPGRDARGRGQRLRGLRPDAVLRRGRRPGRRHRPDHRVRPVGPGHRHPERRRLLRARGRGHRRRPAPGRHRRAGGRRGPATGGHAEPLRHPPAARRAAPGPGRARAPGRVAGRARPAALRLPAPAGAVGRARSSRSSGW